MSNHTHAFSLVGVAVIVGVALVGGVLTVATEPFQAEPSQQVATSSFYSTSTGRDNTGTSTLEYNPGAGSTTTEKASSSSNRKNPSTLTEDSKIFLRYSVQNGLDVPVKGNKLSTRYEISFAVEYAVYERIYLSGRGQQINYDENLVATGTISQEQMDDLQNLLKDNNFYNFPNSVPQFDSEPQYLGPADNITIEARINPGGNLQRVRENEGARGGTYPTGYLQIKETLAELLVNLQSTPESPTNDSDQNEEGSGQAWKDKLGSRLLRLVQNINPPIEPGTTNACENDEYSIVIHADDAQQLKDAGIDYRSDFGGMFTACLTESEIIEAAKIETVSWIEAPQELEPARSTVEQGYTETWKDKLDSNLSRLVEDGTNSSIEPVAANSSGENVYGVFIRASDVDNLKDAGINVNSESGGVITARLTKSEIIRAAQLEFVSMVEASGQAQPLQPM